MNAPILDTVMNLSPLGIIALLSYVVYLLVNVKRGTKKIGNDNFHEVAGALTRIEEKLDKMNERLVRIDTKVNGRR